MIEIVIVDSEPVGTQRTAGFAINVAGKCGFGSRVIPHYAETTWGKEIRKARLEMALGLVDAARLLEVTARELHGVETGRLKFRGRADYLAALDVIKGL